MTTAAMQQLDGEAWLSAHFAISTDKKFSSPENNKVILARMKSFGVQPSTTAAQRAIRELVTEGEIERADGGDEASDARAAAVAEKTRLDRITSAPLTNADYDYFSRMSFSEVEQRFFSDSAFQARYKVAAVRWGFRIPEPPMPTEAAIADENDPSEWRTLDATAYYRMETSKVRSLYKSDRGFARAVDRLIKAGKI